MYHVEMVMMNFMEGSNPSYVLIRCDGEDHEAVWPNGKSQGSKAADVLYEGCGTGTLTFNRPQASSIEEALTLTVSYAGSATSGTDIGPLQDVLTFESGVTEITWTGITADADGIDEGVSH